MGLNCLRFRSLSQFENYAPFLILLFVFLSHKQCIYAAFFFGFSIVITLGAKLAKLFYISLTMYVFYLKL